MSTTSSQTGEDEVPHKDRTVEKWLGGSVVGGIYRIRRMINGHRYDVSTRCKTLRAALKELERFEADPAGYDPWGEEEPVLLSPDLVEEFLTWSRDVKRNTPKWVANQREYLAAWAEDLHGINLRGRVKLGKHVVPALDRRKTARKHRIEVLKAFYGWLRKVKHVISSHEDPTLDLPVPQGRPEKLTRRKIVPVENVLAVRAVASDLVKDVLTLIMATAWHGTEVVRFAREGEIVERPPETTRWPEGVAAVLCVKQKTGGVERWSVSAEALEAARRVRARGNLNERNVNRGIERACKKLGIPVFTYGPLRHSVLTWASEAGESLADVSEILGHHKDVRTTRDFYTDVEIPRKLRTVV